MRLFFLLSLLFSQSVVGQSVKEISDDDKKEIRLLATNKLDGFKDLLNTIAFEDATESQRNEVVMNSYLPSNARVFYDDAVRIEDDLNPEKSDTHKELSVVDYLKNVDLFYKKSAEPSIVFSNVVVSDVLSGDYTYVRVVYTSYFKGVNKTSGSSYLAVQRIADMRAEKVDKKWVVLISRVAFFNPATDKIVMYMQPGGAGQGDNIAKIGELYEQAEQAYSQSKYAESVSLLDRAESLSAKPDAKLLYLKIKSLYPLYQIDKKNSTTLEKAFSIFTGVADVQSYSPMKIREISELKQQFDKARTEEERTAFEQAKTSTDLSQLKLFIQQYPSSAYKAEELLANRESNQKIYEEQNKLLEPDFSRAAFLMKKKAVGKIIASTLFIGIGTLFIISQASSNSSYGIYTIGTTTYDNRSSSGFYTGGAFIAGGLIIASTRGPKKRGRVLQEKTLEKQRELQQKYLSFAPKLNFQPGAAQYGLAIRLKF